MPGLFDGDGIDGLEDTDYVVDEEIDDDDENHSLESDSHISLVRTTPIETPRATEVITQTINKTLPKRFRDKGIESILIRKKSGKEFMFT